MIRRPPPTGSAAGRAGIAGALRAFADSVLRGVGQVMFQNSSLAGLLFIAGTCWASLACGAALVLGTIVATATARLAGADRQSVGAGLFGFNGGLAGIALVLLLQPGPFAWLCATLAAAVSVIVMAAMRAALDALKIPPLTAPFLLVTLCALLVSPDLARTGSAEVPAVAGPVSEVAAPDAWTLAVGLPNGIAQVLLQQDPLAGILFAAGLLAASRMACALALAGSLAGMLAALAMGAPGPEIRAGIHGFNGVLVAIALGNTLLVPTGAALACAVTAAGATPFVLAAAGAALGPLGLPPLTLPFVTVTWAMLLAARVLPRLQPR